MIGTLDSQVIEKFKEFQDKTGKYSDLKIEDVKFESKNLFDIVSLSNGSEFPSSYVKRTEVQGDIPLISAGTKVDIMGHIKTLKGNNISFPNKHYVFNNTKNKWNEVTHYTGKDYYTLTADGVYGGTLILRKMTDFPNGFYTTNVCKVLDFIDENVFEQYFLYAYNMEKQKHKFGFATKANNDNLQKVYIPTPKDYNEKYKSIDIQKAIVEFLEYNFNNLERIKSNIDKRYAIVSKMKKSLIPSTFKKTAIKNTFKKYAKNNNIEFDITDIEFETKTLNTIANFPSLKRVSGGFDLEIEEYTKLEESNKDNYYPLITGTVTNNQISGYVHKDNLEDGSLSNKNVISWTRINADNFFLQDKPVCTNDDSFVLEQHENYVRDFIRYSILETMRMKNFDWGNKAGQRKIKNTDILIPQPIQHYSSYEIQKILTSFINNVNNEIEEYFKKYDRAHNIAKKLRETYLARTFSLINWSK